MQTETALRRYCDYFARLTPQALDRLPGLFAANARFKDPFNDVRGIAAIRRVFEHMYATTDGPRFEVLEWAAAGATGYIQWRFDFAPKSRPALRLSVDGMSRVVFDAQGLALEHVDYWDPAQGLYERLPVIGGLFAALRRRLAAR